MCVSKHEHDALNAIYDKIFTKLTPSVDHGNRRASHFRGQSQGHNDSTTLQYLMVCHQVTVYGSRNMIKALKCRPGFVTEDIHTHCGIGT